MMTNKVTWNTYKQLGLVNINIEKKSNTGVIIYNKIMITAVVTKLLNKK